MRKADAVAIVARRKAMIAAHQMLKTDEKIMVMAVLDDLAVDLKNDRLTLRNITRLRLEGTRAKP